MSVRTVPAQRKAGKRESPPEPEPVNLAELAAILDDITALISRYVVYPSEHCPRTIALKILQTWCRYDNGSMIFDDEMLIGFNGKTGSAKTRALETIQPLVCMPGVIDSRITEAVAFRITGAKQVLFLDEIQRALDGKEKAGIESVLTTGYRYGGYVQRVDPANPAELISYSTFGPKFIGGISLYRRLADDIQRRCYIIDLTAMPYAWESASLPHWKRSEYETEAAALRKRCENWISENRMRVIGYEPVLPRAPGDVREMWYPLLAIAELAGQRWTQYALDALADSLPDDEISTDSASVMDAIQIAANRAYIRLTDYDNAKLPPAACVNKSAAGWRSKPKEASFPVSVMDNGTDFTLRFDKSQASLFWTQVLRANNGTQGLPAKFDDALRMLRDEKALIINNARSLGLQDRAWKSDAEQHPIICIKVNGWDNVLKRPEPESAQWGDK